MPNYWPSYTLIFYLATLLYAILTPTFQLFIALLITTPLFAIPPHTILLLTTLLLAILPATIPQITILIIVNL